MANTASVPSVIVLGAKGRFGRSAVKAFKHSGWNVRAFARDWPPEARFAGVAHYAGDAFDADAIAVAAQGSEVIVNALNPPYPKWREDLPRMTNAVLQAARTLGNVTVMLPGNVYNYGRNMPVQLTEDVPHHPTTRKGRLRENMEQAHRAAARDGIRTVVLRAGDFIERARTGNWFDSHITKDIWRGRVMYPGPLDRVHAWAYLPDMARAMVKLAERRDDFSTFEEFGFPGYAVTGSELIEAMERVLSRKLIARGAPWPLLRILGLFNPMVREVCEMAYLWQVPHALDGAKFRSVVKDFAETPLDEALADALGEAGP